MIEKIAMKTIMILGAGILQLPAIQKAKELGLNVVAVDMNPEAIGFKEKGIIKEVISTIDIPAVVEAAKRNKVDGVMTLASDMPMRSVAAVAKELGIVGITGDTALKATNKAAMRKALAEHAVPIPLFFKVSNIEEYTEAVKHFTNPFIVKPADNSGSRGIFLVEKLDDLDTINYAYTYSRKYSRGGDVVVEEYMRGHEVSVETLSLNGKCSVIQITDKLTTGAPHFVEMGHSQPTQFGDEIVRQIKQVAIAANKAVGITEGPSHTEIIVTSEGPKVVEIGARLGGDCITTHLVPLSTGVDMVECCIHIALGEKPDIVPKFNKGAAIRYFNQTAGVVRSIEGITNAEQVEGVQQISIVHGAGESITKVTDSASRMGFVIAQGADATQAVNICEQALSQIHITYEA